MDGSAIAASGSPTSVTITGTVKWFDFVKGYGFIEQPDGPDVLLHITCLRAQGFERVYDGSPITCEVGLKQGGKQYATKILSVTNAERSSEQRQASLPRVVRAEVKALDGPKRLICKAALGERGFGFFAQEGGNPDIFVHKETLRRCNIEELVVGQGYDVSFGKGRKGLVATEVRVPN